MQAIGNFMLMGGYAVYVWSAYAITAVVLIGNGWWSQRQRFKRQQP